MSKVINKVMRKPNPALRQNIHLATYNKIVEFLKEQKEPVFKSEIAKILAVDFNSVNFALNTLSQENLINFDDEEKIRWRKK